jgi:hypothetical protein
MAIMVHNDKHYPHCIRLEHVVKKSIFIVYSSLLFPFATRVVDTGGAILVEKIFTNFQETLKRRYNVNQSTGGRCEKT